MLTVGSEHFCKKTHKYLLLFNTILFGTYGVDFNTIKRKSQHLSKRDKETGDGFLSPHGIVIAMSFFAVYNGQKKGDGETSPVSF